MCASGGCWGNYMKGIGFYIRGVFRGGALCALALFLCDSLISFSDAQLLPSVVAGAGADIYSRSVGAATRYQGDRSQPNTGSNAQRPTAAGLAPVRVGDVGVNAAENDPSHPLYGHIDRHPQKVNNALGFFDGSVDDVYGPQVEIKGDPELRFFNEKRVEDQDDDATASEVKPHAEAGISPANAAIDPRRQKLDKDQIIAKFGNPLERAPITPVENAPLPFQGAQWALEAGQDELAYLYVKQYLKHLENVKSRAVRMESLMNMAKRSVGMVEEGQKPNGVELVEDRAIYEKELAYEQQRQALAEQAAPDSLEARLNALVHKAAREKSGEDGVQEGPLGSAARAGTSPLGALAGSLNSGPLNELGGTMSERAAVRKALTGKVPVEKDGVVNVYFFLRTNDDAAAKLAPNLGIFSEYLKRHYPQVTFSALSLDSRPSSLALKRFSEESGVSFKVTPGMMVAAAFGIRSSPTILFVGPRSGRSWVQEGAAPNYKLEEILKLMVGK